MRNRRLAFEQLDERKMLAVTNPRVAISDVSILEGNAGTKQAVLTVSLLDVGSRTSTINYTTSSGTAKASEDYTSQSGQLSFRAGERTKQISIAIRGDTTYENNESFNVLLSSPRNAQISDGTGVITIQNDDAAPLPRISISSPSIVEGLSGTKSLNFVVTLNTSSTNQVTVQYATANGSATTDDNDYLPTNDILTFSPGQTSKTVSVTVNSDITIENNEAFTVGLSNPVNATLANTAGTGTITNDDFPPPTISISNPSTSEGNSGSKLLNFVVMLSNISNSEVTVEYATGNGNATTDDNDYLATSGALTFAIGQTTKTVSVTLNGDTTYEPNETLTVTLSNPVNSSLATVTGIGTGTITNDDAAPPKISITNPSTSEGNTGSKTLNFVVTLNTSSVNPVTVQYVTGNGSATTDNNDYLAKTDTLTFTPGQTAKTVSVTINGDTIYEPSETFTVTLLNPVNASLATATGIGTGTITNDDPVPPRISISSPTTTEGNSTKTLNFVVTLNTSSANPITVEYTTADGIATTADNDYLAAAGLISFAPGQTAKTISVTVNGDTICETNETFTVGLSNPTNASLASVTGTAKLDNDDMPLPPNLPVGQTAHYFHTSGNQILDEYNQPVRIGGVNWYGLETSDFVPEGLWTRNYKEMMDQMKQLGFNTIRLPYSNQLLNLNSVPTTIDYTLNPDLQGLIGLQIIDKIVVYAGEIGLKIILDHHRSSAGNDAQDTGLWYTSAFPESRWISDWQMLAQRYANQPAIVGVDLHNEPHASATWGSGSATTDWRLAAQRAGNAVQAIAPNWLIIVEGVEITSASSSNWWGGNLSKAGQYPVTLNVPNQLVYSAHDYSALVYPLDRFKASNYPNNLPAVWDQYWGYLFRQGTAPVLLGEFGSTLASTSDQLWFSKLTGYLQGDFDGNGTNDLSVGQLGMSWMYWCWNPNWGDTGGIMKEDWNTPNSHLMNGLTPLEFQFPGPPVPPPPPDPPEDPPIDPPLPPPDGTLTTANLAFAVSTATQNSATANDADSSSFVKKVRR